jgi:rare lipoprotein A (peptidoglycan hydrolase)
VRTTVIDRGPYANGAQWDLTGATAKELGFEGVEEIQVAKLARAKRK